MVSSKDFLISDPAGRKMQRAIVDAKLLRFLREHIYSTPSVLMPVAGYCSTQGIRQALQRLEELGCLTHHALTGPGQRLSLWGITHVGQAWAFDLNSELPLQVVFEPGKLEYFTAQHHLDLQALRVSAEQDGWTQWQYGDQLCIAGKDAIRLDAVARDPAGSIVGIVCKRTIKAPQRYRSTLSPYLKAIRANQLSRVVWISPTDDVSRRVEKIILALVDLPIDGCSVPIAGERDHQRLTFTTLAKWPAT